jgi:nicotinamide phosphoribosyltransferase
MLKLNPLLNSDFYKQSHIKMYPEGMTFLYSNFTPRKSRFDGIDKMVLFGLQYYISEYLINQWDEGFFKRDKDEVLKEYSDFIKYTLGKETVDVEHFSKLHDLGYLPIQIKALPEGTLVPIRVPAFTIFNTHPDFAWLTNFLETSISNVIWSPSTTATIAREYKRIFDEYALETVGDTSFTLFQGHDFAQRGYSSVETSATSGAGHLLSFVGTDTIPAIQFLQQYYGADISKELVGTSVPATEHSVMTSYGKESEIDAFKRLLKLYPSGILSVVSDSFDLWKVCTEFVLELKEEILSRNGKLVIRPDSGDPADILCGLNTKPGYIPFGNGPETKGVIELLWDTFGGTITSKGYKLLDSHLGTIYGDSISLSRAKEINERLKKKGFASINWVAGIGSFTYQMITRDSMGSAMKATYCEVNGEAREIFKDPITDDGTKRSAKGLLQVFNNRQPNDNNVGIPKGHITYLAGYVNGEPLRFDGKDNIQLRDQVSKEDEQKGLLETIFLDGKLVKFQTLSEIRERLNNQLNVRTETNIATMV